MIVSKTEETVTLSKKQVKEMRAAIEREKEIVELEDARLSLKVKKLDAKSTKSYVGGKLAADENHGIFRMYDVVTAGTCHALEREILNYARRNPGGDITLMIRTPGGDIMAGLALYDSLRTLSSQGHHITTVGRGMVASFGGILLQAGDTRLLGKETQLMIHELSTYTGGKLHEMRDDVKFSKRLNKQLMKILTKHTEMTADELYKRVEATDLWLPAKAAIRLGFADEIG